MIELNNSTREHLTREDVENIKKASSAKKMRLRTVQGFKSLRKNPLNLIIAILFIAVAVTLFINTEPLIGLLITRQSALYAYTVMIFQIAVFTVAIILFLVLISLLGINFKWSQKVENACISAGIYTKARKAPFLLDRYKDKEAPAIKILEIYLNGNDEEDFTTRKKKLESELEWKIIKFEPKGTSRILLYTSPDNVNPKKNNRDDMNF